MLCEAASMSVCTAVTLTLQRTFSQRRFACLPNVQSGSNRSQGAFNLKIGWIVRLQAFIPFLL